MSLRKGSTIIAGSIADTSAFAIKSEVATINADNFSTTGKSTLSSLGMPSSKYIDLTLGASGSTYTAPANGWFTIFLTGSTPWVRLWDNSNYNNSYGCFAGVGQTAACLPIKKGSSISVNYGNSTSIDRFRFVYAEGEN